MAEKANIEEAPAPFYKETKLSKAQQKKENKRKKQAESRAAASAQDDNNAQFSASALEREAFQPVLSRRALRLVDVQPDGDCLYAALAHQCEQKMAGSSKLSAVQLRQMAADFIRKNCWDFLPFLVTEEGTPLVESDLPDYCTKVANMCSRGGSWGGEAELRAISSALQRRIEVLHADDRTTVFGEHFPSERESPLLITFHKHAYALGEHYNSTAPADN